MVDNPRNSAPERCRTPAGPGRRVALWLSVAFAACAAPGPDSGTVAAPPDPAPRPNIVLVLADDLGWSDVGYNGAAFYETPRIDQLARDGMVFDRAYAGGPNCAPMRACLLTGMDPPRHRVFTPGAASRGPERYMRLASPAGDESRDRLRGDVISLAEVLGSAGYRTARFGKWHLGPDRQGFDVSSLSGVDGAGGIQFGNPDSSDQLTAASIRFMRESLRAGQPFFVFVSLWDPHLPLVADPEVVARFEAKLAQQPGPWDPTYAAMVEAVDRCVGRMRDAVRDLGVEGETLFVFASDNGGLAWLTPPDPLRSGKGSLLEGGIRVPTCMAWPGRIEPGSRCDVPTTSVDYLPTFAELAGVSLPDALGADQPVDGVSIVPLLDGGGLEERALFWFFPHYLYGTGEDRMFPIAGTDVLYWRGVPSASVMRGRWKLTRYFEDGAVTLHDVEGDPGETDDLARAEVDLVRELGRELDEWIDRTGAVVPVAANPGFRPPAPGEAIEPGNVKAGS